MSGGHWDYEDRRLVDFGEWLMEDGQPALAALGRLLVDAAAPLRDIDRVYSGDAASADLQPALEKLETIVRGARPGTSQDTVWIDELLDKARRNLKEAEQLGEGPSRSIVAQLMQGLLRAKHAISGVPADPANEAPTP